MKSGFLFNCVQEVFSRTYGLVNGSDPYPLRTLLSEELKRRQTRRILDVGCGSGSYSLREYDYTGIDPNPGYIQFCQRKRPGAFRQMRGEQMTFPDKSFDVVILFSVGHHLDDACFKQVLLEIKRILTNDGVFLFADVIRPITASRVAAKVLEALDEGDAFRNEAEYRALLEKEFCVQHRRELVDQFHKTLFLRCHKI